MRRVFFLLCLLAGSAKAQTWTGGSSSDWDTGSNWSTGVVPNSATAATIFGAAPTTGVTFSAARTDVGTLTFNPGAPAYSFTANSGNVFTLNALGVVNNTTATPSFIANGGVITLFANAGAGNAQFSASNGGAVDFSNNASAGTAALSAGTESFVSFFNSSTAASAVITTNGGTIGFNDTSTAGNATLMATGAGGSVTFFNGATAGNAAITVGSGSSVFFQGSSSGGNATITVNAGGALVINGLTAGGVSVGSVDGAGNVFLGSKTLTIGGNGRNTTISGVVTDSGLGGTLIKIGDGTLVLDGAPDFVRSVVVNGGTLEIGDAGNPGTALTGVVFVNPGGTLSGHGASRPRWDPRLRL
ncbi:MAG TPA: hypothetical protein VKY65_19075 [Alphaproteobacteria bacterium]|nr:hypothetical protein [Alphaproteobacteria bacterium]